MFYTSLGLFAINIAASFVCILLMIFTAYILKKTMFGRRIEAIGEDLKSADSMGLKIAKTQFIATCVGGAFAGLSGVYLTLSYVPVSYTHLTLPTKRIV